MCDCKTWSSTGGCFSPIISPAAASCKRSLDGVVEWDPMASRSRELATIRQLHCASKHQFYGATRRSRKRRSWQEQIAASTNAPTALPSRSAGVERAKQRCEQTILRKQGRGAHSNNCRRLFLVVVEKTCTVPDRPRLHTRPEEHVLVQELNKVALRPHWVQLRVRKDQRSLILQDDRFAVDVEGTLIASPGPQHTQLTRAPDQVSRWIKPPRPCQPSKICPLRDMVRKRANLDEPVDKLHAVASAVSNLTNEQYTERLLTILISAKAAR